MSVRTKFVSLPAFALLAMGAAAAGSVAAAHEGVADVESAMSKYMHDIQRAEADGYINLVECVVNEEGPGAMGVHVINPGRMQDPALVANEPEILLFEPTKDGLVLRGVEYFVAIGAPGTAVPNNPPPAPTLLGQKFHGPMAGHNPEMPPHYDMHLWFDNPGGTFAAYNTNVSCPSE
jgi:hypothetical protein